MKTKFILSVLLAASLTAAPAFAQMNPNWDYNPTLDRNGPPVRMEQRGSPPPVMFDNRDNRDDRYDRDNRNDQMQRGYGPRRDMYIGGRLHRDYRSKRYEVRNWKRYHLSPPPRGYRWVRAGNDYLLAAIATNIILQISGGR